MHSFYQKYISPLYHFIGHSIFGSSFACRFSPTCSEYSRQAYQTYGIITGTKLTLSRLLRCQPFSKGGLDPLPDKIN